MTPNTSQTTPNPQEPEGLWEFSLRVYARRPVRTACLALQDSFGADVNVVLLILWLAREGKTLTPAGTEAIGAVSDSWQVTILRPLRTLRRSMSAAPQDDPSRGEVLSQLKDLELHAERLEQRALETMQANFVTHSAAAPHEAAALGFVAYEQQLRQRFPLPDLKTLIGALAAPIGPQHGPDLGSAAATAAAPAASAPGKLP